MCERERVRERNTERGRKRDYSEVNEEREQEGMIKTLEEIEILKFRSRSIAARGGGSSLSRRGWVDIRMGVSKKK